MKRNRLKYNLLILTKLVSIVIKNPELRFGQILIAFNILKMKDFLNKNGVLQTWIEDPFYEEPDITYKRLIQKDGL